MNIILQDMRPTWEGLYFKHQMRRHGINEIIRVRDLSAARAVIREMIARNKGVTGAGGVP